MLEFPIRFSPVNESEDKENALDWKLMTHTNALLQ